MKAETDPAPVPRVDSDDPYEQNAALDILNATLDALRNEPKFLVLNRRDRRNRERAQRRQVK